MLSYNTFMGKENRKEQLNILRPECCRPPEHRFGFSTGGPKSETPAYLEFPWTSSRIESAAGLVPVVRTELLPSDRIGSWKARCGIGRMKHRVEPGLYAVGQPTDKSHVFVSANYKMSFDRLRSQLGGIDAWILVLDTKGINVWCAAGKGTFGTNEIVSRIAQTGLKGVVSHRKLIVPQLGASGVGAHKVKELSGFRVIYGPVRAGDIPAFLEADMKATPEMRRVRFSLRDRLALIPNDLVQSADYALLIAASMMLLSGFGPGIYSLDRVFSFGLVNAVLVLLAYVVGTMLPQALLPWLPGRMFSVKGAWIGLILALFALYYSFGNPGAFRNLASVGAWFFIAPALASFIAMNFTGSSTYTSLSGVLKEMRIAVPVQITLAAIGLGLWITGLFV